MKILSKNTVLMFVTFSSFFICNSVSAQKKDQMVRIAEIEIEPAYLEEYKKILKEESEASFRLEAGVIAIFPMFEKERPYQVRILEIYADKESYQSHLKTPHFLVYKNSTLKMVKSLKLVEMDALDVKTMPTLFKKY